MLRDQRYRARLVQILLIAAVGALVLLVVQTTMVNLQARGIPIGFEFLSLPSRFVISESLLRYRSQDPYIWAIVVGLANSVFISILVVVLSTVLGLMVGIGRLSSNPLVAGSCRVWVEVARNTPPIVLLFFLYSLWWRVLPPVDEALTVAPGTYLSMRGLMLPTMSLAIPGTAALVLAGAALAGLVALTRISMPARRALLVGAAAVMVAVLLAADITATVDWPRFERGNYRGGFELTPELTTVVIGLTLYTTGFVAEIVRAGVLSVAKGQWEAARALGLRRGQILRLIVVPQMLRVIMPPLTSQYINVVKNSTLAIAVGYPDFLAIMGTVINKSNHALEGVAIILAGYLAVNLTLSLLLNWYNRRIALVER